MSALPLDPAPNAVVLKSIQPTMVSVSHALKRQVRSTGAQRWGMRLTWAAGEGALTRGKFAALWGALIKLRGQFGTCTVTLPAHTVPMGMWGNDPKVKTTTNSGVTIPIKALTANQSTACAVGDFVKFTGHSKVYLVVETVASNSSGEATITIEPPLRAAVTADESLVVQNVPFTMALSSDNLDGQLSSALRWGMDVELLEVI